MIRTTARRGEADLVALSPREIDVVRLVRQNKRPAEIARALHLEEKTVSDYVFRLCQGLGLRGRQDLMFWGFQNPQALSGKPARAGLHPRECACGSPACALELGKVA